MQEFTRRRSTMNIIRVVLVLMILVKLIVVFGRRLARLIRDVLSGVTGRDGSVWSRGEEEYASYVGCYKGREKDVALFLTLVLDLLLSLMYADVRSMHVTSTEARVLGDVSVKLCSMFKRCSEGLLRRCSLFTLSNSVKNKRLGLTGVYSGLRSCVGPILGRGDRGLRLRRDKLANCQLLASRYKRIFCRRVIRCVRRALKDRKMRLLLGGVSSQREGARRTSLGTGRTRAKNSVSECSSRVGRTSRGDQRTTRRTRGERRRRKRVSARPTPARPRTSGPVDVVGEVVGVKVLRLILPPKQRVSAQAIDGSAVISKERLRRKVRVPSKIATSDDCASKILFRRCLVGRLKGCASPSGRDLTCRVRCIFKKESGSVSGLGSITSGLLFVERNMGFTYLVTSGMGEARTRTLTTTVTSKFLIPPTTMIVRSTLLLY